MRVLIFLVALFLVSPVWAQSFFTGLPDIPLMPGLVELEERALSFDKPEGRILVGAASVDDSLLANQVQAYYAEVLPQFGWRALEPFLYVRGTERLEIGFDDMGATKILEITISP